MNQEMEPEMRVDEEALLPDREFMSIDDVDIRDDFMFAYIIRNPDICIELLQYLLPGQRISEV